MKDLPITVRAAKGTAEAVLRRARFWAKHFDHHKRSPYDADSKARRGAAAFVVPALQEAPGFTIRHYGDSILVEVAPEQPGRTESDEPGETDETLKLKHGMIGNQFLRQEALVTHFDPTEEFPYTEKGAVQITLDLPDHAGEPEGFVTALELSIAADLYSHYRKIKATLYSGWLRAAAQAAMGIGHGSDEPESETAFKRLRYKFAWPESDGVVFAIPEQPLTADELEYREPMKPVMVRTTSEKVYIGPLLHWDEAVAEVIPSGDPPWTINERWQEYIRLGEDTEDLGDGHAQELIRTFWGIPSGVPPFDADSNVTNIKDEPDPEEVLKQRIASGLITEYELPEDLSSWAPITDAHGWAYAYNFAAVAHVVMRYDPATQWPKSQLVYLSLDGLTEADPPQRDPPVSPSGKLINYLAYWVGKNILDLAATNFKLTVAAGPALAAWNAAAENAHIGSRSLLTDFQYHVVTWKRYPAQLNYDNDLVGYLDIPVTGTDLIPAVHVKAPDYIGGGVVSWSLTPPLDYTLQNPVYRTDIPAFGFAPLSVFFTRTSQMILAKYFVAEGHDGRTEDDNEEPKCSVESRTTKTTVYPALGRYRSVGLNVKEAYDSDVDPTTSTTQFTYTFMTEGISAGDDPTDPGRGESFLSKQYLCKAVTRNGVTETSKRTALVFPEWDREAVYIGHPQYGRSGTSQHTGYSLTSLRSPYVVSHERCFPGYWARSPDYFACTEHERCPSTPGSFKGSYPRIATVIHPPGDTDCPHVFSGGPWAQQCEDIDALVAANQPSPVYVPPPQTETTPGRYTAEVSAFHSSLNYGERVKFEQGEEATISGWWEAVSPDPITGDRASMSASANTVGGQCVLLQLDLNAVGSKTIGNVSGLAAFKSATPGASFIGKAING